MVIGYSTSYKVKNFDLKIPIDHRLPLYQSQFANYDRFLPHLARQLDPNDLVIDIGANVGDTVAAMLQQNSNLRFICVEADKLFYRYLTRNIVTLRRNLPHIRIDSIFAFVGRDVHPIHMVGGGGTKRAQVEGKTQGNYKSFFAKNKDITVVLVDSIIADCDKTCVRLLKSDVDGFDYDIINSAIETVTRSKPLLYFEMDYTDEDQMENFIRCVTMLHKLGYEHWYLFDNQGNFLIKERDIENINQLIFHVFGQKTRIYPRTIHYLDVLVCTNEQEKFIDSVIETY